MAGEMNATLQMTVTNGNFIDQINETAVIDQATGAGGAPGLQNVGFAAHEALAGVGDLTAFGRICIKNLDTTNFINWGVEVAATFYPVGRLLAGEWDWWRLDLAAALFLQADTGACLVQIRLYDA